MTSTQNFLIRFVFVTGIATSLHTTHAMEIKLDTTKLEADCFAMLGKFVPRLGYSGIAFATGIAGTCTSYNGFKRLCNGLEKNDQRTKWTGAAELSAGLGTTAVSIIALYRLWR